MRLTKIRPVDDQETPHFHTRHAGTQAKVCIDTLEITESSLERDERLVLAWAELHRDELAENWRRARAGCDTESDRATEMIGLTPDITAVRAVGHGTLHLTFADGPSGEVQVLDRMRGPVFNDARTPAGFARVVVEPETGTIMWPSGGDLARTSSTSA